jgi:hypothetical protein
VKAKKSTEFRVLFLGKKENPFAERAAEWLHKHLKDPFIFIGDRRDKLPDDVLNWQGDLLISFIGSWIIGPTITTDILCCHQFSSRQP